MRKAYLFVAAIAVSAAVAAAALTALPLETDIRLSSREGDPNKGAYLARMSGCIACHTDAENGGKPLAGGLALKTDFGTFYSPNLTMDETHGIGAWSITDFARALRKGVSPAGDPYYPAFPYPFYASLTDQDIADLWAAFNTVPPVAEPSKEQDLGFPFSFRPGLKIWRAAFFDSKVFEPEADRSELWNRGKYIVEGPAHCGACHTPRNFAGARQAEMALHGADELPDGGKSPPIHAKALSENGWTVSNLKYALKTGVMPDGDAFGGSMGEVVSHGTSFLNDRDLEAIAVYLLEVES